jgi:exodeoxyribonuclease VII large subunit
MREAVRLTPRTRTAQSYIVFIASNVITVSELNRNARLAIEKLLPSSWVTGEISNFTQANSGHWYFTLKDQQCSVRCAFFRNRNQFMDWNPTEGNKVEVRAQATLYEPRGDYQLTVDVMRRAGQGDLYEEFLRLKAQLEAEGLFHKSLKLTPPLYPSCVGIITSLQAAALQDALKTLQERWPISEIIIYPTSVQGIEAADSMTQTLAVAISRRECDVLLLIRGGGSLEDLHAYNNETLARTIRASLVPIITGIGHETDFCIADFVSDVRAATPTAAAQYAVPDKMKIRFHIVNLQSRLDSSTHRRMEQSMQRLDGVSRRVIHPSMKLLHSTQLVQQFRSRLSINSEYQLNRFLQALDHSNYRLAAQMPKIGEKQKIAMRGLSTLKSALTASLDTRQNRLKNAASSLQQLNPVNVLSRGYCIVQSKEGNALTTSSSVHLGSDVKITLKSGYLDATITKVTL